MVEVIGMEHSPAGSKTRLLAKPTPEKSLAWLGQELAAKNGNGLMSRRANG